MNILIVEDNEINLHLALSSMKKLGLKAITAKNGQQALDIVEGTPVDIIFMDCHMPILNGYEATKSIRALQIKKQPVIIAVTASALIEEKEKCIQCGMDDFIEKPLSKQAISEKINKWQNRKNSSDDIKSA